MDFFNFLSAQLARLNAERVGRDKLTKKELTRQAGLCRKAFCNAGKRGPTLQTMQELCKALGVRYTIGVDKQEQAESIADLHARARKRCLDRSTCKGCSMESWGRACPFIMED